MKLLNPSTEIIKQLSPNPAADEKKTAPVSVPQPTMQPPNAVIPEIISSKIISKKIITPKIITIANIKGGVGKTTLAIHLIVGLMEKGYRIGVIDFDLDQTSLENFCENRTQLIPNVSRKPNTSHTNTNRSQQQKEGLEPLSILSFPPELTAGLHDVHGRQLFIESCVNQLKENVDIILIDTPAGNRDFLLPSIIESDCVISPINESFIDLDVFARYKSNQGEMKATAPGPLTEVIYHAQSRINTRVIQRQNTTDQQQGWLICCNRISQISSRNSVKIHSALRDLAGRFKFNVIAGLSERAIFRELYPLGLTVFDHNLIKTRVNVTLSHLSAKAEVNEIIEDLLHQIYPDGVDNPIQDTSSHKTTKSTGH